MFGVGRERETISAFGQAPSLLEVRHVGEVALTDCGLAHLGRDSPQLGLSGPQNWELYSRPSLLLLADSLTPTLLGPNTASNPEK